MYSVIYPGGVWPQTNQWCAVSLSKLATNVLVGFDCYLALKSISISMIYDFYFNDELSSFLQQLLRGPRSLIPGHRISQNWPFLWLKFFGEKEEHFNLGRTFPGRRKSVDETWRLPQNTEQSSFRSTSMCQMMCWSKAHVLKQEKKPGKKQNWGGQKRIFKIKHILLHVNHSLKRWTSLDK